jgi:predicted transcriptional regulator
MTNTRRLIVELLIQQSQPLTAQFIADQLGTDRKRISNTLSSMAKRGIVQSSGRNKVASWSLLMDADTAVGAVARAARRACCGPAGAGEHADRPHPGRQHHRGPCKHHAHA